MDTLQEWLTPPVIWFVAGAVLLLLEFSSPGVIIFFFGIGAWLVAVLCLLFDLTINVQLAIFIISSLLLLVSLRRWFKDVFQGRMETGTAADDRLAEFVGKKAIVTKAIKVKTGGRVEFRGTHWNAEAEADIPEGTPVEIIDKNNITLIVTAL